MCDRQLPEELQEKAKNELNETPETRQIGLKYIKNWLLQQSYICECPDDQWILNFLRGCKFDTEKTKQKIHNYFTNRKFCSEFFTQRDPLTPKLQRILKSGYFWVPLPKSKDTLAPRILYYPDNLFKSSEKLDPISQMKVIQMVIEILLLEDESFVINGFEVIQYLGGFSLTHLTELSLSLLKKMLICSIHMYPTRMKGFHFINVPFAACAMYNMLKPFIGRKIKSRIFFHKPSNYTDLHQIVSKTYLPMELGGENYNVSDILNEWKFKIERYRYWFMDDNKFCFSNFGESSISNNLDVQ